MGAYASNLSDDHGTLVSEVTHPSRKDWISQHAKATGLKIGMVERLWKRFQQLGSNQDGILTSDVLQVPPATQNVFSRNILANMRDGDNEISFETFCRVIRWAQTSDVEERVRCIFYLINGGAPVSSDILSRVLARVYPDDSQESINKTTDLLLTRIDTTNDGEIDESQFVQMVMMLPDRTVSNILEFKSVPSNLQTEADTSSARRSKPGSHTS